MIIILSIGGVLFLIGLIVCIKGDFFNVFIIFAILIMMEFLSIGGCIHLVSSIEYIEYQSKYEKLKEIKDKNNLIYASIGRDIYDYNYSIELYRKQIDSWLFFKVFCNKNILKLEIIE